jgi:hypothetical protein
MVFDWLKWTTSKDLLFTYFFVFVYINLIVSFSNIKWLLLCSTQSKSYHINQNSENENKCIFGTQWGWRWKTDQLI